ncbi:MAG: sigma-70 family RNA polymerase sigma factor [Gammaproteobacteria bacterium]|jgi:RNA polymerase sigma-70 factor (ECF subfamily)|nr:sigma-70 family RNA polymerase sigma factor [Gammaproteobacteria bacterium]
MLSRPALEAAYLRLEKPLYNYLYRWFWDPETCRDLIHDAFERIWRKRERVDEAGVEALAWTVVINLARNHHRRARLVEWIGLPLGLSGGRGPDAEAELGERDRRLRDALEALPASAREILLLDIFAGVPRQRLAGMLGIPAGTLASRKHAAVNRLKELLDDED